MRFRSASSANPIGQFVGDLRVATLFFFFTVAAIAIVVKLFSLQVIKFDFYYALASDQHELLTKLFPQRGQIYIQDRLTIGGTQQRELYPAAINKKYMLVYAQPKYVTDPADAAARLAPLLGTTPEALLPKLARPDDPYEPIQRKVEPYIAEQVKQLGIEGIKLASEMYRFYPERTIGAQLYGFVSASDEQRKGVYGIEGYFDESLRGSQGSSLTERSGLAGLIGLGSGEFVPARDGSDVILTIDKTIQSFVCRTLAAQAAEVGAKSGAAIVMEPTGGAIIAMCSYPEFDPNEYNKVADVGVYNNTAIYGSYEPGSVFKAVTMAAALDVGAVTPDTTYIDEGQVQVDDRVLRNSSRMGNGIQTMTQVLEKSLNTGTVFAMRQMGPDTLKEYIRRFNFGQPTGIELDTESKGNLASLDQRGEIFAATASFGQGITVTPIQMVAAVNAIANGGTYVRPHIIAELRSADGTVTPYAPPAGKQVISRKTATLLSGMLASVVEHSRRARVPNYYIAGKTGTAQIAQQGGGYSETLTNHSFIGFGPIERPAFTLILKLEEPEKGSFAETTLGETFARVVRFLLEYYKIPPSY